MFSSKEKAVLAILAAVNFTHIVDFMILMPLGPQLMRTFGIQPQQFGLLVSSYTFAAGCSGLIASLFIDRFDRKKAILAFYLGFALGTIGCSLSGSYVMLLLMRSLTGFFGGVLGSLVLSIASDAISVERRGTAMGIVMGSFSVASVFGVPFSLSLANHFHWHAPFIFLGFLSFLIWLLIFWKLPVMTGHLEHQENSRDPLFALKAIFKHRAQLSSLLFLFFLVFGQFCLIPFLSPSFVANGGMPEAQLPLIYMFGGLVSIVASPVCGRLSDRFGKKQVFYIGASLSLLPILWVTHLGPSPTWLLILASSCFFIVMSGRMVPAMAMVSSAALAATRGSFMSVSASVQQLAAALSSYVAGLIILKDSNGALLNYNYVGWMAVAFSLVAIYLVRGVALVEAGEPDEILE